MIPLNELTVGAVFANIGKPGFTTNSGQVCKIMYLIERTSDMRPAYIRVRYENGMESAILAWWFRNNMEPRERPWKACFRGSSGYTAWSPSPDVVNPAVVYNLRYQAEQAAKKAAMKEGGLWLVAEIKDYYRLTDDLLVKENMT